MIFPTGINSSRLLCMAYSPLFLRQNRGGYVNDSSVSRNGSAGRSETLARVGKTLSAAVTTGSPCPP